MTTPVIGVTRLMQEEIGRDSPVTLLIVTQ
jgi:hypothetical protein